MDIHLRELCEQASQEKDPERLMEIVRQIMATYEEMEKASDRTPSDKMNQR